MKKSLPKNPSQTLKASIKVTASVPVRRPVFITVRRPVRPYCFILISCCFMHRFIHFIVSSQPCQSILLWLGKPRQRPSACVVVCRCSICHQDVMFIKLETYLASAQVIFFWSLDFPPSGNIFSNGGWENLKALNYIYTRKVLIKKAKHVDHLLKSGYQHFIDLKSHLGRHGELEWTYLPKHGKVSLIFQRIHACILAWRCLWSKTKDSHIS